MTVTVPLEGSDVTPHREAPTQQPAQQPQQPTPQERPASGFQHNQYIPPPQRQTLHKTRLGQTLLKQTEANAPAPVPQQTEAQALAREIDGLRTSIKALAASQLGNAPRGYDAQERELGHLERLRQHNEYGSGTPYSEDGNQPQWGGPDATRFDFLDEQDTTDFYRLSNEHIERTVQQRLEAERAAQQKAARDEDMTRQGADLRAKFGRDANFHEALQAAAGLIIESGYRLSAEAAYLQASAAIEARSGRRGTSYMPKDVKTLGQIMRYNQQTGRSGRQ